MDHQAQVDARRRDEEGASLVEYALLVALIAIVCILAITFLGERASDKFSSVGSSLDGSAATPAGGEICNGVDDDGDGVIDEGVGSTWYVDADGDGFGNSSSSITACAPPAGYTAVGGDANDGDASVH